MNGPGFILEVLVLAGVVLPKVDNLLPDVLGVGGVGSGRRPGGEGGRPGAGGRLVGGRGGRGWEEGPGRKQGPPQRRARGGPQGLDEQEWEVIR
jgi:hypothetical protein